MGGGSDIFVLPEAQEAQIIRAGRIKFGPAFQQETGLFRFAVPQIFRSQPVAEVLFIIGVERQHALHQGVEFVELLEAQLRQRRTVQRAKERPVVQFVPRESTGITYGNSGFTQHDPALIGGQGGPGFPRCKQGMAQMSMAVDIFGAIRHDRFEFGDVGRIREHPGAVPIKHIVQPLFRLAEKAIN